MASELEIFKRLTSVEVQDRHIPVVKERVWVLDIGSRVWSNNICQREMGMGAGIYGRRRRMAVPGVSPACNGLR